MDTRGRILIVEDDIVQQVLAEDVLGEQFQVELASSGQESIAQASQQPPDLILMDIMMADMSGYDACRAIKQIPRCNQIPVIFLSGLVEASDRLKAYEAGGCDFLPKPFSPAELLSKVNNTLNAEREKQRLTESANSAFQTAMSAMTSASEMGLVMDFVRQTHGCHSYPELAQKTLATVNQFGLTGAIQIRGLQGTLSFDERGPSSPLETSILNNLVHCGRIVSFGKRSAFNYGQITLMISDMPTEDADRCGRLRDHLAIVAENASARCEALDMEEHLSQHRSQLLNLLNRVRDLLHTIDQQHQEQHQASRDILETMINQMEDSFMHMGLTERQEREVAGLLQKSVTATLEIFAQRIGVDDLLTHLLSDLKRMDSCDKTPQHPAISTPQPDAQLLEMFQQFSASSTA